MNKERENHRKAALYFNLQPGQVLHHIDPSLRHNDRERYEQWNIEDLVVMERSEHIKFHQTGCNNSMYGRVSPMKGKKLTTEQRKRISKGNKDFYKNHGEWHWYTNGVDNKMSDTCPEGYWLGRTGGWKWHTKIEG